MIKILTLGILIGLANLVPGVSGGTIAVISGMYEKILSEASKVLSFKIDKNAFLFILTLIFGIGIGIFGFSKLIDFLFLHYKSFCLSFFSGLILGGSYFLFKDISKKTKKNYASINILFFTLGILTILVFLLLENSKNNNDVNFLILFLGSIFASSTMVLPGISGSSVLLFMGIYDDVINYVSNLQVKPLIPVFLGAALGLILIIKILNFVMKKWEIQMLAFLLGLTVSGAFLIFPFKNFSFVSLIFLPLGFFISKYIESYYSK